MQEGRSSLAPSTWTVLLPAGDQLPEAAPWQSYRSTLGVHRESSSIHTGPLLCAASLPSVGYSRLRTPHRASPPGRHQQQESRRGKPWPKQDMRGGGGKFRRVQWVSMRLREAGPVVWSGNRQQDWEQWWKLGLFWGAGGKAEMVFPPFQCFYQLGVWVRITSLTWWLYKEIEVH